MPGTAFDHEDSIPSAAAVFNGKSVFFVDTPGSHPPAFLHFGSNL